MYLSNCLINDFLWRDGCSCSLMLEKEGQYIDQDERNGMITFGASASVGTGSNLEPYT